MATDKASVSKTPVLSLPVPGSWGRSDLQRSCWRCAPPERLRARASRLPVVSAQPLRTSIIAPSEPFRARSTLPGRPDPHSLVPREPPPRGFGRQTLSPCHRECVSPPASLRAAGASPSTPPATPTQAPPWLAGVRQRRRPDPNCSPFSPRGGGGRACVVGLSPVAEPSALGAHVRTRPLGPAARGQSAPRGFAGGPAPPLALGAPVGARRDTPPPRPPAACVASGLCPFASHAAPGAGSQCCSLALARSLAFRFHLSPGLKCRGGTENRRGAEGGCGGPETQGWRVAAPLPPSGSPLAGAGSRYNPLAGPPPART